MERLEEIHRLQRGLSPLLQFLRLRIGMEEPLVFPQCILDLAIAGQRRVVRDTQADSRLAFGLLVIADATFGHQASRLMGEAMAAFADLGFGVLAGAVHGSLGVEPVATVPQPIATSAWWVAAATGSNSAD